MAIVLAVETSCDESAVAVLSLEDGHLKLLSNEIASQVKEHSQWGGVVPEIASRMHVEALPFLIARSLENSGVGVDDLDAVAATVAPGLSGSLLIGSITARTIAYLHNLPFLGVHHLEGHLASIHLSKQSPIPPYLVLLVSGGHTELIKVDSKNQFKRLGRSHDDAAGEAFDKVARLLELPYPGGPAIQKIAEFGNPNKFIFPKGRVSKPEGGFYPYDFSFSGLKTAVLRQINSLELDGKEIPKKDIAASFENIVAQVLVERSLCCAKDQDLNSLVMVGGVASNNRLRRMMLEKASESSIKVFLAPHQFCTDNAAMIGTAALRRLLLGKSSSMELGVSARLKLDESESLYFPTPPF